MLTYQKYLVCIKFNSHLPKRSHNIPLLYPNRYTREQNCNTYKIGPYVKRNKKYSTRPVIHSTALKKLVRACTTIRPY